MLTRRHFAAALGCATLAPPIAFAQNWPTKPIRIVVPYAAGGADLQIRPIAAHLQRVLGQRILIENIGGAGGMTGANAVLNSAADGHTLLYTALAVLTVAPKLSKASYSIDSFDPVCNVIDIPFVVANRKDSPIDSIAQIASISKAEPGKLSFGSAGHGTATHMTGEALASALGVKFLHVPFQGMAPAVVSLIGGNIDFVVGAPSVVMPHVESGKLKALAFTSPKRFGPAKNVPTLRELSVNVVAVTKYGFFAPAGTPAAVAKKFSRTVEEAVQDPAYQAAMQRNYSDVAYQDPQSFGHAVRDEDRYYAELIDRLDLGAKR